jgi:hypothetical protein
MLLDDMMPRYDFHEVHAATIAAPPERVYQAIYDVRADEVALMRELFAMRRLPMRLRGRPSQHSRLRTTRTLLEQLLASGFMRLGEEPEHELVIGAIGQFWKGDGDRAVSVKTAQDFLAFDDPAFARAAMNFTLTPGHVPGTVRLRTETRIVIPKPTARRRFALYWRAIFPGSALIRRMWLRAIRIRAERGG